MEFAFHKLILTIVEKHFSSGDKNMYSEIITIVEILWINDKK